MKKYFFLLALMVPFLAISQKETAEIVDSISINADKFIGRDGFDNYFYLKNEVFYKKTKKNVLQYSNFSLGNPTKVDIINPLKIILFYEKFNTIVLLDSQLNEIQKIDFSKSETELIANCVGLSSLNSIWVYNSINQQLLLYSLQSNPVKTIGNPLQEVPVFYQSNFNYFYWITNQNELFSMSIFGNMAALGNIKKGDNYQIINDHQILISLNNEFYFYDFLKKFEYQINILEKSFKNYYYQDQILSIFTDEKIINYKIIVP